MTSDAVIAATPFFMSLPALKCLKLPEGSEGLLPTLVQQPKLSSLTVLMGASRRQLANLGRHPFRDLGRLKVAVQDSGDDLKKVAALLNCLPVGKLEEVVVEHTASAGSRAQKGFPALAKALVRHAQSLVALSIESYANTAAPSLSDPTHLLRLKTLVNLQGLVISTPGWQLDIDVHQLDELTTEMGQLRLLNLNGCNDPEDYADPDDIILSDDSFYILARNCPLLEILMMRVDFVTLDNESGSPDGLMLRLAEAMEHQARFRHMDYLNVFGSNILSGTDPRGRDSLVLNKAAFVIATVMPPEVRVNSGFPLDEKDATAYGEDACKLFDLLPKAVRSKRRQFETTVIPFPIAGMRVATGFEARTLSVVMA